MTVQFSLQDFDKRTTGKVIAHIQRFISCNRCLLFSFGTGTNLLCGERLGVLVEFLTEVKIHWHSLCMLQNRNFHTKLVDQKQRYPVGVGVRSVFLKVFFHVPPLQTRTLSITPQQTSKWYSQKISHYLLWRNKRGSWTKQTPWITSDTSKSSLYLQVTAITTWRAHNPLDHGAG